MGEFRVEKGEIKTLTLQDKLWFGQFKDQTIEAIIEEFDRPQYIQWCIQQEIFELDCDGLEYLEQILHEKRRGR